jgi:hypothetical protein
MLLVYILIPLVYAGADVFIAHCLLFFGQYVLYDDSMIHWCGGEDLMVGVAQSGQSVVDVFELC